MTLSDRVHDLAVRVGQELKEVSEAARGPLDMVERGSLAGLDMDNLPHRAGIYRMPVSVGQEPSNKPPNTAGVVLHYDPPVVTPAPADGAGNYGFQFAFSPYAQSPMFRGRTQAGWSAWVIIPDGRAPSRSAVGSTTITAADEGKVIHVAPYSGTTARTVTLPSDGGGTRQFSTVMIRRGHASDVIIRPAEGAEVRWAGQGDPKLRAQYSVAYVSFEGGGVWYAWGDLAEQ